MSPAISFRAALAGFRELGLDAEPLLEPTGLTLSELSDPFTRCSQRRFRPALGSSFRKDARPDPADALRLCCSF